MANHKSSIKRIRQANAKRLHNRYYAKTARNAMRVLRATEDQNEAREMFPKVCSMLEKTASRFRGWPIRLSARTQDFHS